MIYLIPKKSIIADYLSSPELIEVSSWESLIHSLKPNVFTSPAPYNCDFLITYSEFKKLSVRDRNHTRKHIEEILNSRVAKIGGYKKKNIDVFILETSKKNFGEVCSKLSEVAKKNNVELDYSTLSLDRLLELEDSVENFCSGKMTFVSRKKLLSEFFKLKEKYNKHKIPNMNRLTANGLSKFDDWFINGYVSYKHVMAFARKDLKLPAGKTDEKTLFQLFGYLASDSDCFTENALKYIKKLIKATKYTTHKLAMMLEYYKGNKIGEDKYYDYKPPYEYLLLGSKRNVDRQFLIYLSLALGLSTKEIKTLFKKCNCVLTDFLKEDALLLYFAENNYLMNEKQRGAMFRFLWKSI